MLLETFPLILLVFGTFCVAYFVAAIGPTGGMQLAVTGATVPSNLLIPIHAWISSFSAISRVVGLRDKVRLPYVLSFILPSAIGTVLATSIGNFAGFDWIKIIIGAYILFNALGVFKRLGRHLGPKLLRTPYASGLVTGFITVFIGASGPLLWALMSEDFEEKEVLSATHSACLVFQHFSKIVMFGLIGLSILAVWPLLLATALASGAGTYFGQKRLRAFDETTYRRLLTYALILSGSMIIWFGIRDAFGLG